MHLILHHPRAARAAWSAAGQPASWLGKPVRPMRGEPAFVMRVRVGVELPEGEGEGEGEQEG